MGLVHPEGLGILTLQCLFLPLRAVAPGSGLMLKVPPHTLHWLPVDLTQASSSGPCHSDLTTQAGRSPCWACEASGVTFNLCVNGPMTSVFRAGFPQELLGEIAFVVGGGFVCFLFLCFLCICLCSPPHWCALTFVFSPRSALSIA